MPKLSFVLGCYVVHFCPFFVFPILVVIGNRSDIAQKEPIYFVQYDEK